MDNQWIIHGYSMSKHHCSISTNSGWIAIVHSVTWLTVHAVHAIHCCSHRDSESLCEICYWYCWHIDIFHQNLKQSIATGRCPIRLQNQDRNEADLPATVSVSSIPEGRCWDKWLDSEVKWPRTQAPFPHVPVTNEDNLRCHRTWRAGNGALIL